jgi:hypothetical protein
MGSHRRRANEALKKWDVCGLMLFEDLIIIRGGSIQRIQMPADKASPKATGRIGLIL